MNNVSTIITNYMFKLTKNVRIALQCTYTNFQRLENYPF